jgi:branched-chain amino acid transport system substrate-binding protein
MKHIGTMAALAVAAFAVTTTVQAQKAYGPGVTDNSIKLGNTMPYSGPASAYGAVGKAEIGFFQMINDQGGINGRKIEFISLDDGYSPPRTVEQTRKLVEQEGVLFDLGPLGTAANTSIHKYLNQKKVPQLFVSTGAAKWGDPEHFPWTMGWQPNYQVEGHIYARYILDNIKDAKIGILYQNDDYGKDYVKGLKDGLGDKAATLIVKEVSYEVTDPTIDQQIGSLQGAGANVFYDVTTPKFAAQAIRRVADVGWKPVHILNNVSAYVGAVLTPAGLDKSKGIISTAYIKDPTDPQFANDPDVQAYLAFMKKYDPDADPRDQGPVVGYSIAQTAVQVLKQCGDELTRENVMKQAASLHDLALPLLLPGIRINTSPTNFYPIRQEQLIQFDGKSFVPLGSLVQG